MATPTTNNNTVAPTRKHTDPITNLQHHWKYLQEIDRKKKRKNYESEFDFIEEKSFILPKDYDKHYCTAKLRSNEPKNRYPDVLAVEGTRVPLDIEDDSDSDYINANFIMGCSGDKKGYISTQGPTEVTVRDFWKMCWKHKVYVIVMLTKEFENGIQKSVRYWSAQDTFNTKAIFSNFEITLASKEKDSIAGEDLFTRIFKVKNLKEENEPEREIIHFQYTGWPDHGLPAPSHAHHFIHLMSLVDDAISKRGGPICIHCSAGIGRTGTFCAIHINIHIMREYFQKHSRAPPLSIVNTIILLRKQRHGMVQTKDQYLFCYQIILEEYVRLKEAYAKKQLEASKEAKPVEDTNQKEKIQDNVAKPEPTSTAAPQTNSTEKKE